MANKRIPLTDLVAALGNQKLVEELRRRGTLDWYNLLDWIDRYPALCDPTIGEQLIELCVDEIDMAEFERRITENRAPDAAHRYIDELLSYIIDEQLSCIIAEAIAATRKMEEQQARRESRQYNKLTRSKLRQHNLRRQRHWRSEYQLSPRQLSLHQRRRRQLSLRP